MEGALDSSIAPAAGPSPPSRPFTLAELRARRDELLGGAVWAEGAALAARIADRPDSDANDCRAASGALLQCDRATDAIRYASRSAQIDPNNFEYALHAGCVLNVCGDYAAAIPHLLQAARLNPDFAETFQQLASAADQLGSFDYASKLALRAFLLDPKNPHRGLVVAHLFARQERWLEAAEIAERVIESAGPSPALYRSLASYESQAKRHERALAAIDYAIALDPENAEYHGFRAITLLELDRFQEADAALHRALALDPTNLSGRRHAISILIQKGDIGEALRYGGELLARAPHEPEFADCMRFLLETKSLSEAAADFSQIAELKRRAPPRALSPPTTFGEAGRRQWRTIMALVLRDIRSRYGESKISFFWALMEPFVHIGVLAVVFQFTMHGQPPIGHSFFLFYFTGVMPYLLLSHLISHLGGAVRAAKPLMQVPSITPVDILLAKSIVEMFTTAVVFIVFVGLFQAFGVDAIPAAPQKVLVAFGVTWVLGTGLGFAAAALSEFGAAAESVVGLMLRFLYFASGIFYVPGKMPLVAREILVWNPFLHLVDYSRTGFFRSYEPAWMDISYPITCAVFSMLFGMACVAVLRRRMRMLS